MTLSFFITVIPDHDKPQPPGCLLERDSDCVNVMITNTMSGQVPANLERLFDRFYRADSSRFYNTEGAGLGLSITRSIIHAHGGELSAEQQGREIVFKVRLLMD